MTIKTENLAETEGGVSDRPDNKIELHTLKLRLIAMFHGGFSSLLKSLSLAVPDPLGGAAAPGRGRPRPSRLRLRAQAVLPRDQHLRLR